MTKDDFSVDEILRKVKGERTGAVVAFVGVVRGEEEGRRIRRMEMEAYEEMAERELASLRQRAMEEFGLEDAVIIHRIGPLAPGDNIVLIVVSSAHRKEAFAGAQFLIDELKKVVPLWKKEFHAGGEEWVEG